MCCTCIMERKFISSKHANVKNTIHFIWAMISIPTGNLVTEFTSTMLIYLYFFLECRLFIFISINILIKHLHIYWSSMTVPHCLYIKSKVVYIFYLLLYDKYKPIFIAIIVILILMTSILKYLHYIAFFLLLVY